jgi:hypothetical protein
MRLLWGIEAIGSIAMKVLMSCTAVVPFSERRFCAILISEIRHLAVDRRNDDQQWA